MSSYSEEDHRAVSEFLEREWDPITLYDGTLDEPWPPGEYDLYASRLLGLLLKGADKPVVLQFMSRARKSVGLDDPQGHDDRAADALLTWWHARETSCRRE